MKIGEVSKRTGCNIETIRYYERIGVIEPPPRKGGRHRLQALEMPGSVTERPGRSAHRENVFA